jgi:hypothetical protein
MIMSAHGKQLAMKKASHAHTSLLSISEDKTGDSNGVDSSKTKSNLMLPCNEAFE